MSRRSALTAVDNRPELGNAEAGRLATVHARAAYRAALDGDMPAARAALRDAEAALHSFDEGLCHCDMTARSVLVAMRKARNAVAIGGC